MTPYAVRKPAVPPSTWRDASRYYEQGYTAVPIDLDDIDAGSESPSGPWMALPTFNIPPARVDDYGVAINAGGHVIETGMAPPSPPIAVLRIDVQHDKKLVHQIIEKIIKPCLAWAPGVDTKHFLVRETIGSAAVLIPLRWDDDARSLNCTTQSYVFGSDPKRGRYEPDVPNVVSVGSHARAFVAAGTPYRWRDGVDLLAVHRDLLPVLAAPYPVIQEIEPLLAARGRELHFSRY